MKGYRDASGEIVYDIDPQWRKYMEMSDKTVKEFNEFENTGFSNIEEATKIVNLFKH